jgi:hypothetical protein
VSRAEHERPREPLYYLALSGMMTTEELHSDAGLSLNASMRLQMTLRRALADAQVDCTWGVMIHALFATICWLFVIDRRLQVQETVARLLDSDPGEPDDAP